MKLNKKLKYVLGSIGLAGLAIIPASVGLVSCSKKEEKDVIEYYQDAQGAIFEGQPMQKGSYPFKCDFNLTDKTCSIVDWTSDEPNYKTLNLGDRDGVEADMQNKNNTIRIPSQVIYNGEIFSVVSFSRYRNIHFLDKDSDIANNAHWDIENLDLSNISNLIQRIEFDSNLKLINDHEKFSLDELSTTISMGNTNNLLAVYQFPEVLMDLSSSPKLDYMTPNKNGTMTPFVRDCPKLTISWISDNIRSFYYEQFANCTSLMSVKNFNNNTLETISHNAFENCSSLESITLPDSVKRIESKAFSGCSSLTSINIPDGVIYIEDLAFSGCSSLTSITIPESVTYFGEFIFGYLLPEGFKIYFHSQQQLDLFLETNSSAKEYCEVISN